MSRSLTEAALLICLICRPSITSICWAARTTEVIARPMLAYQKAGPTQCRPSRFVQERQLITEENMTAPCRWAWFSHDGFLEDWQDLLQLAHILTLGS
jgi:hypothetical protein